MVCNALATGAMEARQHTGRRLKADRTRERVGVAAHLLGERRQLGLKAATLAFNYFLVSEVFLKLRNPPLKPLDKRFAHGEGWGGLWYVLVCVLAL